ncbi:MAG: hypothetical protein ACJ74Z_03630 [Bryobacteraceae bacterium]
MSANLRLLALFLVAITTSAQHRPGRVAGSSTPPGSADRGKFISAICTPHVMGATAVRSPFALGPSTRNARAWAARRGFGQLFRSGYFAPYYGLNQGYSDQSVPMANYSPPYDNFVWQPTTETNVQQQAPAKPAQSVVHEYKWRHEVAAAGAGGEPMFTIALKDGSTRSAVITWVEDRNLHYIDPQDRHWVLTSQRIDHDTTRRLNKQKSLNLQLPPSS